MDSTHLIVEQARAFLSAYETLDKSLHKIVQHDGLRFRTWDFERISIVVPAITCLAFAAEITIKALIVQSASGEISACPRGHRLNELFEKAPNDIQLAIARALNKPLDEVNENLKKNAKAFEEWRYSYENGAWCDDEFLRDFVKAGLDQIGTASN